MKHKRSSVLSVEYITEEGLRKMKDELHNLKYKIRPGISQKVATAREHGDLKENAEYHAAREELALVETKIQQLQSRIGTARIINEKEIPNDKIYILTTALVKNLDSNSIIEYTLVSPAEADFKENKISVSSPIGKALLGKSVGEIVSANVPAGTLNLEVLEIKK
jgi:transcription elongation factor GreA